MDLMLGFNREVVKNVSLKTTMTLFSPYSDMATMVVNWDLALWFTINKFLTANIHTQLLYDQDVNFINDAGETYNSALQFKEVLGLGLTYSF
jgi:hypothetical protein